MSSIMHEVQRRGIYDYEWHQTPGELHKELDSLKGGHAERMWLCSRPHRFSRGSFMLPPKRAGQSLSHSDTQLLTSRVVGWLVGQLVSCQQVYESHLV